MPRPFRNVLHKKTYIVLYCGDWYNVYIRSGNACTAQNSMHLCHITEYNLALFWYHQYTSRARAKGESTASTQSLCMCLSLYVHICRHPCRVQGVGGCP